MIIGFSGKHGVGKTTVCDMVRDLARFPCCRIAFGDALKEEAARLYDFPIDWAYNDKNRAVALPLERLPKRLVSPAWDGAATVREILQYYATDVVRGQSPDYWIERLDARVKAVPSDTVILVDDVRFPNELAYVRERGACYRICPYPEYNDFSEHESETALDNAIFDGMFCPQFGRKSLEKIATFILAKVSYLQGGPEKCELSKRRCLSSD